MANTSNFPIHQAADHLYFSYGSNISRKKLSSRGDADTPPIAFTEAIVSRLPDWKVVYTLRGAPPREPVMGSIERCEGEEVYGMTYRLKSEACWRKLFRTEGIQMKPDTDSYHIIDVQVETEKGPLWVKTLVANPKFTVADYMRAYMRPSRRYMGLLISGAEEESMPSHYIDKLKATPTARQWETSPLVILMAMSTPFVFLARRMRMRFLTKPIWTFGFALYVEHEKRVEEGRALWWVRMALAGLYAFYVVPAILLFVFSKRTRRFYYMLADLLMKKEDMKNEGTKKESMKKEDMKAA